MKNIYDYQYYYIEFDNPKNNHDGRAMVFSELVDGLREDAVRAVEISVIEDLNSQIDSLTKELNEMRILKNET